eukprot:42163_1
MTIDKSPYTFGMMPSSMTIAACLFMTTPIFLASAIRGIFGSIIIGVVSGLIISALEWFLHDLYFICRIWKYGSITSARLMYCHTESTSSRAGYPSYSEHTVRINTISYSYTDDQTEAITKQLVYKYIDNELPTGLMDLCVEFLGFKSFEFTYDHYDTGKIKVDDGTYRAVCGLSTFVIKYDRQYPHLRYVLKKQKGYLRKHMLLCSVMLLIVCGTFYGVTVYILADVESTIRKLVILITSLVASMTMISIASMCYICRARKTFCCRKRGRTQLHVTRLPTITRNTCEQPLLSHGVNDN